MGGVRSDHGGGNEAGWTVETADENVRLPTVVEVVKHVSDGEQVAVLIDKEGVAVENVAVAAAGGSFAEAVHDANKRGIDGGVFDGSRSRLRQDTRGGQRQQQRQEDRPRTDHTITLTQR